jgi:hypothetical protein
LNDAADLRRALGQLLHILRSLQRVARQGIQALRDLQHGFAVARRNAGGLDGVLLLFAQSLRRSSLRLLQDGKRIPEPLHVGEQLRCGLMIDSSAVKFGARRITLPFQRLQIDAQSGDLLLGLSEPGLQRLVFLP